MQEAASKVWSLEQGDLMPEPRPPYPTSAFAAFLLELSPTLSPSPRPCHPGSSAHLGIQTLGVPEGLLALSFCLSPIPLHGPPEPVFWELSEEEACC